MSATSRQKPDIHLHDCDRMPMDSSLFCPDCHENPIPMIRQKIPFRRLRDHPGCVDKTRTLYPALSENDGVYLKAKIRYEW